MDLFSLFKRQLPIDTQQIEQAIAKLERQTSAELRVVVEHRAKKATSAMARAEQLFHELGMQQTAQRNAVLIYLAFKPHYVAVVGDQGIHAKVGDDFWQSVYQAMREDCQKQQFTQAICRGIAQVEQQLAQYFPIDENDVNELANDVVVK